MSTFLQLVTPRLILRPWQEHDRAPFAAMNADAEVMTYFPAPMTAAETDAAMERYNMQLARDGFTMLAAEHRASGELAGIIGMQTMRFAIPGLAQPAVEIGWRLGRRFQGLGLATEGARAVLEAAFTTHHLAKIVAITAVGNEPSRNVMRKLGLTHQPSLDFDHPNVPVGHPHLRQVLYSLGNPLLASTEEVACSVIA